MNAVLKKAVSIGALGKQALLNHAVLKKNLLKEYFVAKWQLHASIVRRLIQTSAALSLLCSMAAAQHNRGR